jgi:hypothetical protein
MKTGMWSLIAAASIPLLMREPCSAQEVRITDVELRAAYCLGVVTRQYEEYQSDKAKTPARDDAHLFFYQWKILSERRNRLRDYLDAKGILNGRNARPIELALRHGTADAAQCSIDVDDPSYKGCTAQCGPQNSPDDYRKCDARCPPSEACVRVKRCLENFLPF